MQELEGEKMFKKFKYMIEKNFELKRGFDSNKDITKDQINEFINKGAIFIDVRSPQEFREGHIDGAISIPDYRDGAISIPDYRFQKLIQQYSIDKESVVIVYCSTGHRSQRCQKVMQNMGYKNVYNLYEGIII